MKTLINTPLIKIHIPENKGINYKSKLIAISNGRYSWLYLYGGAVVQVNTFKIFYKLERLIEWARQPRIDREAWAIRLYRSWDTITGEAWTLTGKVLVLGEHVPPEALEWHLYDLVGCCVAHYSGPGRSFSSQPGYTERELIPGVRIFDIYQRGGLDI